MLDNNEFNSFSIRYFGVDWKLSGENLVCEKVHYSDLFKSNPEKLYINWASAIQIQFHIDELDQSFDGEIRDWTISFIENFVNSVANRISYMGKKFSDPFKKYL